MILSMTGFGKSENKNNQYTFSVEIKALNNRFIEVSSKMHPSLNVFEKEILDNIKKKMCKRKSLYKY